MTKYEVVVRGVWKATGGAVKIKDSPDAQFHSQIIDTEEIEEFHNARNAQDIKTIYEGVGLDPTSPIAFYVENVTPLKD